MRATSATPTVGILAVVLAAAATALAAERPSIPPAREEPATDAVQPLGRAPAGTEGRTVEQRLRDLEYPELRRRDPAEIDVLKTFASSRETLFKTVEAKYQQGMRVGRKDAYARTGYAWHAARAKLAYAEHRVRDAVVELVAAARFARKWADAVQAAYGAGVTPLERVIETQMRCAEAELALIRAERVAQAAGIDIADIPRDSDPEPRPRRQPGPPLRPEPPRSRGPNPIPDEPIPPVAPKRRGFPQSCPGVGQHSRIRST